MQGHAEKNVKGVQGVNQILILPCCKSQRPETAKESKRTVRHERVVSPQKVIEVGPIVSRDALPIVVVILRLRTSGGSNMLRDWSNFNKVLPGNGFLRAHGSFCIVLDKSSGTDEWQHNLILTPNSRVKLLSCTVLRITKFP